MLILLRLPLFKIHTPQRSYGLLCRSQGRLSVLSAVVHFTPVHHAITFVEQIDVDLLRGKQVRLRCGSGLREDEVIVLLADKEERDEVCLLFEKGEARLAFQGFLFVLGFPRFLFSLSRVQRPGFTVVVDTLPFHEHLGHGSLDGHRAQDDRECVVAFVDLRIGANEQPVCDQTKSQ